MKRNSTFVKTGFALLASAMFSMNANATSFTATTSGNFSASSTWSSGTAPSSNISGADNIIINNGVTVTLDEDVTINNPLAQLAVNGTISGSHSLNIQSGSFNGAATGVVTIHNLTLGSTSTSAYTGFATLDNMYNSQLLLSITGNTHVNDTLGLYSGVAQISSGTTLTLSGNATVLLSGGSYSNTGGGSISLMGNVNLMYTGSGSQATSSEISLSNVNNVSVNLGSNSNQLNLSGDLTIAGQLSLRNGALGINGHNLTLNGTIDATGTGTLTGSNTSNLSLGGSGSMGTLMFTSGGNTINNLTVNGSSSSSASLGSDLIVAGTLTLTNGRIDLTGTSNLTLTGTDSIQGGSSNSYVSTSGTGSLVINIAGSASVNNSRTFQIGTSSSYAPVKVTSASTTSGNFSANAHSGIFANGTSGLDLSTSRSSVNTSWNVESDITTGANITLEAYWNQSAQVNSFSSSSVYLSHYTGGAWDAAATAQATAHAGGMYSVSRTGITSFSPFAVFSGYAAGISEVNDNASFSSYPNPAKNTMTVSVNSKTADNIKVFDVLGNQVAIYPVRGASTIIDISNLNSGVYLLSVNNTTQKFVKQ
jgi:hypothetical protein